jgi:hypothetical protein
MTSNKKMAPTLNEALSRLHGEKLTTVQFIHDYVQLGFEVGGLTAHSHPVVRIGDDDLEWPAPVYEHELCQRIGKVVVDTRVNGTEVSLVFDDGVHVNIPIGGPRASSPESLEFSLEGIDMIWIA